MVSNGGRISLNIREGSELWIQLQLESLEQRQSLEAAASKPGHPERRSQLHKATIPLKQRPRSQGILEARASREKKPGPNCQRCQLHRHHCHIKQRQSQRRSQSLQSQRRSQSLRSRCSAEPKPPKPETKPNPPEQRRSHSLISRHRS